MDMTNDTAKTIRVATTITNVKEGTIGDTVRHAVAANDAIATAEAQFELLVEAGQLARVDARRAIEALRLAEDIALNVLMAESDRVIAFNREIIARFETAQAARAQGVQA
jgi:hypothetical protein